MPTAHSSVRYNSQWDVALGKVSLVRGRAGSSHNYTLGCALLNVKLQMEGLPDTNPVKDWFFLAKSECGLVRYEDNHARLDDAKFVQHKGHARYVASNTGCSDWVLLV